MADEPPRKRGRPAQGDEPIYRLFDKGELDHEERARRSRLEQLQEHLGDLDRRINDTGITHRDYAGLSVQYRATLRERDDERSRLDALNPPKLVEVSADGLVSEVLAGLEVLPRDLVDRIVAGALDVQGRK